VSTDYTFWFIDRDDGLGVLVEGTAIMYCNYCPCPYYELTYLRAVVTSTYSGVAFDEEISPSTDYRVPIQLFNSATCAFRVEMPRCVTKFPVTFDFTAGFIITEPDAPQFFNMTYGECGADAYFDNDYYGDIVTLPVTWTCRCPNLIGVLEAKIVAPFKPAANLSITFQYNPWVPECPDDRPPVSVDEIDDGLDEEFFGLDTNAGSDGLNEEFLL
jgi:hypothetical protein